MTYSRGFFHKPHSLFETEIGAGHGTNRTEVNDIEGVSIGKRSAWEKIDPGIVGSVDYPELASVGYLAAESDTSAAEHATLLIVDDSTTKVHFLALGDLGFCHTAIGLVV